MTRQLAEQVLWEKLNPPAGTVLTSITWDINVIRFNFQSDTLEGSHVVDYTTSEDGSITAAWRKVAKR